MLWARFARFYGWTHEEISKLSIEDFWVYSKAMEVLTAEEMQIGAKVSSVPHMEKKHRTKFLKDLERRTRVSSEVPTPTINYKDADRLING